MNINAIKELIELSKLLENSSSVDEENTNDFVGKYVIVRWYDAGVWAGKLIDGTHGNIILEDARMLWRWWNKKGIGLSSLAVNGLDETKSEIRILEPQKKILINDLRVSTFYICEPQVEKQIREYPIALRS